MGHVVAGLLELRCGLLGESMLAAATCPGCAEPVELPVQASDLLALESKIVDEPGPLTRNGWMVRWRPPTPGDLATAADQPGAAAAESFLLRRCVLEARGPHAAGTTGDLLPDDIRAELAAAITEADPLAEVLVAVTCPGCDLGFQVELDVASFVWREVDALARSALLDVAALAGAFGWSEGEVLSLSDSRRASYLRIVRDGVP